MAYKNKSKRPVRLGSGFSDGVHWSKPSKSSGKGNGYSFRFGPAIIGIFAVLMFVVLSGRLYFLTGVKGEYYQKLGDENRIRHERISAQRGVIYSSDGVILAENRPIYLSCSSEEFSCQQLSREDALVLESAGKDVVYGMGRTYPQSAVSAHIVGYMSEITQEAYEAKNKAIREEMGYEDTDYCQECYGLGDYVGIYGTEQVFEDRIRGVPGKRLIEVDSSGKELTELARVEPKPGENIVLGLDVGLQQRGIDALEKKLEKTKTAGAFVAMDPKTGEIKAMYSSPTFNPNLFVYDELPKESTPSGTLEDVFTNEKQPLFNRVISGLYPPASTYKIITATAGIEEGIIDQHTTVEDNGVLDVGTFSFSNWYYTQYGRTEGQVNIVKALTRSNDIFFYKLGEWVGPEKLEEWSKRYGLNTKTGIELSGEEAGIVRRDRQWYLGDTYHLSIGQGDMLTTPLQVASYTQAIANDGTRCRPTILRTDKGECQDMNLSDETIRLVQEGLVQACSPGGTGWPLFDFSLNTASSAASLRDFSYDDKNFLELDGGGVRIPIACKTGTAEFGHPDNETHAWLTAYAPAEDPEIVITVLVEAGGEGSTDAAPIVKEMLQEWFGK